MHLTSGDVQPNLSHFHFQSVHRIIIVLVMTGWGLQAQFAKTFERTEIQNKLLHNLCRRSKKVAVCTGIWQGSKFAVWTKTARDEFYWEVQQGEYYGISLCLLGWALPFSGAPHLSWGPPHLAWQVIRHIYITSFCACTYAHRLIWKPFKKNAQRGRFESWACSDVCETSDPVDLMLDVVRIEE